MGSVVSTLGTTAATAAYSLLSPSWLKAWPPLQLLFLITKRTILRENNLNQPIALPTADQVREGGTPATQRTHEGSGNNSNVRTMGMSGCPFARNTPKRAADASVGPDVGQVSEQLLARPGGVTKTKPLVNLLGGAWLQFMVHDWFEVQKDLAAPPLEFPLPGGGTMPLQPASVSQDDSGINKHDMWWSGAQIYGTTPERNAQLRTGQGGQLLLNPDGTYLALDEQGVELVGFNSNLWSGIQLLHYLLVKEHNAVCDMLKSNHPDWNDDQLFHTARKIITALVARVHTIEWTTAITQHPMGRAAQYILWYGLLGTLLGRKLLWLTKLLRPLGQLNTLLTGIPGSSTVLAAGQPFAHSEEFVMVYRMHALLPDKVVVVDAIKGTPLKTVDFGDIVFRRGTAVNITERLANLFTSLGMGHAALA